MRFDSAPFVVLLGVAVAVHRLLPWGVARPLLLVLSYVFYGFEHPIYCLLLFSSTLVDYLVARGLEAQTDGRARKLLVGVSVAANLGLLLGAKYAAFIVSNLQGLMAFLGVERTLPEPSWAVPVGISFYTFQTLSYTLDVYSGKARAERDLGVFSLYVSFFPQLMAGPIERAHRLLGQLRSRPVATVADLDEGLSRVLFGLVKKTVLADRLALLVDRVYADPTFADGLSLLLATVAFGAQVYLDFSGYCDIAIGSARMLGVSLTENFRHPVFARTPLEFWARWHITLGTWFRDYVLAPMARRTGPGRVRRLANLMLVFLLIGLWHGPSWHFVAFGVVAGGFVVGNEALRLVLRPWRALGLATDSRLWTALSYALMAVHGVVLSALFRAPSFEIALQILWGMVAVPWKLDPAVVPFAVLLAACLLYALVSEWLSRVRGKQATFMQNAPVAAAALRALWLLFLLLTITHLGVETAQRFIYFQF
ncbi:MAG: hypothetical protein MUC50_13915 [Myxococcota bacterium]|jgi:D-alanyl-lipoteichoic acid acyltransferase DltB (MBOAT superfamily)|nr:hypothetical protein [Myxococcota bacterium]